jgi:4-hydroxy-tetrahydrodipicolinate synthase
MIDLTKADGLYVIAATPFEDDGAIDFASMDTLIDHYIEAGCTGMTILGMMGEAPKLAAEESVAVVKRFIGRVGKLPIIVGVTAPGLAAMRALARTSMDLGAAGVMIAPPSTLRTDDQIVNYYAQAVEAIGTDVPFVIQDYPLSTTVQMTPEVIRRIVEASPSCLMLKHEDWPGLEKITTLRRFEAEGRMRHISILCGNGGLFLDFEMSRGADGAMTGYGFADTIVEIVRLAAKGDRDAAHDLFDAHLPLIRYEQQPGVGLAVRKHVLKRRGIIKSDAQRRPGATLTPVGREEVEFLLRRIARTDPRANF